MKAAIYATGRNELSPVLNMDGAALPADRTIESHDDIANPFASPYQLMTLVDGLLDGSLPRESWTHRAHLVATLVMLRERPDIDLDRDLPGIIRRYNVATGTPNTESGGYHETITRFYLAAVRDFNSRVAEQSTLIACRLIQRSALADKRYPLEFYSRERLFSTEARRSFLGPDLKSLSGLSTTNAHP